MIHRLLAAAVLLLVLSPVTDGRSQTSSGYLDDSEIKMRHFEELSYPPIARSARIEGAVVLKLTLDEQGRVVSVDALSGARLLVPDAVANAEKWTFEPNAAKAAVLVYIFDIEGGCSEPRSFFRITPHANVVRVSTCSDWTL